MTNKVASSEAPSSNASARFKLVRADDDSHMMVSEAGNAPLPTDVIGQPRNPLSGAREPDMVHSNHTYSPLSDRPAKMPDGRDKRSTESSTALSSDEGTVATAICTANRV